jgi:hypothetical protein
MTVRDKLNSVKGYKEIISLNEKFISGRLEDIKKLEESEKNGIQLYNRPNKEAIEYNLDGILQYQYYNFLAKYSAGVDVIELKKEINPVLSSMEKSWEKSNGYVQMVWMLSIGIMLEIEDGEFSGLVKLVEKDNPNDFLVDFLIRYRVPSWQGESEGFMFKRPYQATQEIVRLTQTGSNNMNSLERLKKYLSKEWYRGHSDAGWHDAHKCGWNIHTGYWSFESGALAKILRLDDSSLKDTPYYPYDMVHWKDELPQSKFDTFIRAPLKTPNSALRSVGKMLIYFSKLRFCLCRKP